MNKQSPHTYLWVACTLSTALFLSACGGGGSSVSTETQQASDQYVQRRGLQLQAQRDVVSVLDAYVDKTALANTVQNDFSVSSKVNRMRGYAQEGQSPVGASGNAPSTGGVLLFDVLSAVEEAGKLGQVLKPVNQGVGLNTGLSPEAQMKAEIRGILSRFEAQERPLRPQMKSYLAQNAGATLTESGHLVQGNSDQMHDMVTPLGTVVAAVLDAHARGEDPNAVAEHFAQVIEKDTIANPPMLLLYEEDEGTTAGGLVQAQSAAPTQDPQKGVYRVCAWWDVVWKLTGVCQRWGMGGSFNPFASYVANELGRVPYSFERPSPFGDYASPRVRSALRLAMDDWENQTQGAVRFRQAAFWEEISAGLFFGTSLLKIAENSLKNDKSGEALIGPSPASYLLIDYKLGLKYTGTAPYDKDDKLMHTARHELGHVVGLYHEHQRWDRDDYVDIGASSYKDKDWFDFGLVKEYNTWGFYSVVMVEKRVSVPYYRCSFSWRRGMRCSWETNWVSIWVPEWRYIEFKDRNASGSAQFDCLSVMLYANIPYRDTPENHCTKQSELHNNLRTKLNISISSTDAATIAERYAK